MTVRGRIPHEPQEPRDESQQVRGEQVQSELLEIHFDLPARQSEDSQDGYLDESIIAGVFQLNATLSFGFF